MFEAFLKQYFEVYKSMYGKNKLLRSLDRGEVFCTFLQWNKPEWIKSIPYNTASFALVTRIHPRHQDPQQREKQNSRLFSTSCCCDWWPKSPYPRFGKLMLVIPCAGLVLPNLQYIDASVSGLKDVGAQVRVLRASSSLLLRSFVDFTVHDPIWMFTASFGEKWFRLAGSKIWRRKFIFPRTLGGAPILQNTWKKSAQLAKVNREHPTLYEKMYTSQVNSGINSINIHQHYIVYLLLYTKVCHMALRVEESGKHHSGWNSLGVYLCTSTLSNGKNVDGGSNPALPGMVEAM